MGVAERDYMRDVPVYRDTMRGSARTWALVVVAACAAIGGLTQLHPGTRAHPVVFGAPGAPTTFRLSGPTQVTAGALMTASGGVRPGVSGIVTVDARWDGGAWYRLATTQTAGSTFFVRYPLDRPGVADVRVTLPNGDTGVTTITVLSPTTAPQGSPAA